jgi:ABC-type Fe3+/spermidine/putrescine transport system ATPase subunit
MAEKLAVEDVCHRFNSQEVLHHISFAVSNGEFLSILGPSGCGKTTLLRILIGLLEPSSGQVYKDGKNITRLKPSERNMGIVFQNYALFQNMTVLGNVEYALKFNRELKQKSRSIAEYMIEQVGLVDHMHKKPHKLSGGQQQRVAIARTLALNPDIILFDEPMSALDAATRLLLRGEIKKIQQNFKSTVIYITHDQEEAFALSDRIIVMNDGIIEQMDTPENIIQHPVNQYIRDFVILNLQLKMASLAKYMRISDGEDNY